MNFFAFVVTCFVFTIFVYQATGRDLAIGRQEEAPAEAEGDDTTERPPLYPILVNLFATALGQNETTANTTVNKFIHHHESHKIGVDPNAPSSTTVVPPPTTEAPATTENEEVEEEEDEDENRRERRREKRY